MPGTLVVEATTDNVFVQIETQTGYGKLSATVKLPRQLLNLNSLQQLADGEVALLAVLNAGFPAHVTNVARGTRVRALLGLQGTLAAARHVIANSSGCRLAENVISKLISDGGCMEKARTVVSDQRPTIVAGTMSFTVSDPTADEAAKEAASASLRSAAATINLQILNTTVQRAAVMGSNSRLEKSDKLLTCEAGAPGVRARRVQIGGAKLEQVNREAIAAHRAKFCRVHLGLPQIYGMHTDAGTGQFYAKPSRSDSSPSQSIEVDACMADTSDALGPAWHAEAAKLVAQLDGLGHEARCEAEKELTVDQLRLLIHKLLRLKKIISLHIAPALQREFLSDELVHQLQHALLANLVRAVVKAELVQHKVHNVVDVESRPLLNSSGAEKEECV